MRRRQGEDASCGACGNDVVQDMRDPRGGTVLFDAESRLGRRCLGRYIAVGAVVAIIIAMPAVYLLRRLVVGYERLYLGRSFAVLVARRRSWTMTRPPVTSTDGSKWISGRRARRYTSFAIACLLPVLALAPRAAGASDAVVERHLEAFFEAFVGRELSRGEVRRVTDEFISIHSRNGQSRAAIRESARRFGSFAKIMRGNGKGPAALSLRHVRIELNYFHPDMQRTLFLRLLTEPDPVHVVDVRTRRLMTERDVVALANLHRFATSEGPPRHTALSRKQVEELVAALKATVGAKGAGMPQFFGEAAVFWAGVQEEWPRLDAEQKRLARAYAARTWRIRIPVQMYGRLWGLDPRSASSRQADDVSARISAITDISMQLGNLPHVMDAIFGR